MLRLTTFGPVLVERDGEPLGGVARQRRVLALLAIAAVAGARGVTRDRLLGLLWSESDPEKARQTLTQSLYHTRKAVGEADLWIVDADVRLNPQVIASDVGEFEALLDDGQLERAVALYRGPFLDGFYVNGAPEFERWSGQERSRLMGRYAGALEALAKRADAEGDGLGAVAWRRSLAALDPLNSRIALELMHALAAAGDRAGAIRHARIYETLLREELDASPDAAITELAERLRDQAPQAADFPEGVPRSDGRSAPDRPTTSSHLSIATNDPTQREVLALVDAASETSAGEPSSRPRLGQSGRRKRVRMLWALLGAAAVAGVVAVIGVIRLRSPSEPRSVNDLIVIAPFRVSGADPSLAYLREGMVDLLFTKLTDDEAARAADAGAVMSAWQRAGLMERSDVPRAEVFKVARQLGGDRLLLGSVVGTPGRLVVNATLLSIPSGDLRAQASVDGPADSLTSLVDRLVARLLAAEAGEWERLASRTSTSVQALRAFLDGQATYRHGRYGDAVRHFRRALERDQSFAMAGLGLALAAERVNARTDRVRGLAAAWAARNELTERDSIFLQALAGPRYPAASSAREQLTAWERAAAAMPDRADVWHELGERLFYDGRLLGVRQGDARASNAFRRAAELDPVFASPLQYVVQLAAEAGDTAGVRAASSAYLRLDSIGDLAAFVRWRSAIALSDTTRLRELRRRFAAMSAASLRTIALSSQYTAAAPQDAERALTALEARAVRGTERFDLLIARHALELNRGRSQAARRVLEVLEGDQPLSSLAQRMTVLDRLYGGGDSLAAANAVASLTRRLQQATAGITGRPAGSSPIAGDSGEVCVLGQWHATGLAVDSVARFADVLRSGESRQLVESWEPTCAALIEAIAAVRKATPDALGLVVRLDSIMEFGPPVAELRDYANLALARLYEALGDQRRALGAIRRRPHMQEWPRYLAATLRHEGRLAAATGDSTGAVTAYRHYLVLRASAEDEAREEADTVRRELQRLTLEPRESKP